MNKLNNVIRGVGLIAIFAMVSLTSSCVSNKKIAYFQDIQTVNQAKLENAAAFQSGCLNAYAW
jgi:polysaccharide export outer membrane protein